MSAIRKVAPNNQDPSRAICCGRVSTSQLKFGRWERFADKALAPLSDSSKSTNALLRTKQVDLLECVSLLTP